MNHGNAVMENSIKSFKIINLLEGISFILLLFFAMPVKYYLNEPMAVTIFGWTHGLLFIAYCLSASSLAQKLRWPDKYLLKIVIAGMIPFAFLVVNKKIKAQGEIATS